ncbi:PREDICTED: laccase-15-like [Nicotiana attenuata]|uniref:Laccase n=1 Tax=Nicotiana attenuata TaxID=49451 RepID=A0A1J6ITV1_NICAT|nr:PREDICTED: laccase-15-like [Nicotiana attenuata]OIT08645.1 laccase-15 [Nicotiana attenuata]
MAGEVVMRTHTLSLIVVATLLHYVAFANHYHFIVKEASFERLCKSKEILTVNGKFPGPTLYAHKGSTLIVDVYNKGKYNLTIHWHGVKQPRNPWSDGPEYITQCPIQPGSKFRQKIVLSDEEGTIWWHAHSAWARATVHGAIVVYPKPGTSYSFPKPHAEIPIILGEWWKDSVVEVLKEFTASGGQPRNSDAFMINGQPGDFYPCSKHGTFKLEIKSGKTYLLRILNAAMNEILFFAIAKHKLTVVGTDGSYTKPLTRDYIAISPGQTLDCLFKANQEPNFYYMAARAYTNGTNVQFDNTTTTAIVKYEGNYLISSPLSLPYLPSYGNTPAAVDFSGNLRSLASKHHPISVPLKVKTRLVSTVSINLLPCPINGTNVTTCQGPNGTRLSASMNNISFLTPTYNILEAYYYHIKGVFGTEFPSFPPYVFNYTADILPLELELPEFGTQVKVLEYNTTVELVLQGTNLVTGLDHPMHLHGYNFYVVGWGLGNFNEKQDPQNYNLVDPPRRNTVAIPRNGWIAIRFRADNPGVWIMHCHIERHLTWGMQTVFIVKNGHRPEQRIFSPPQDMPPC